MICPLANTSRREVSGEASLRRSFVRSFQIHSLTVKTGGLTDDRPQARSVQVGSVLLFMRSDPLQIHWSSAGAIKNSESIKSRFDARGHTESSSQGEMNGPLEASKTFKRAGL